MNTPIQKEVKPINFIFHRAGVKVSELAGLTPITQELFEEAIRQKLTITGPVHWHYFGFMGDESKPFTLEISLPVAQLPTEYDGRFHFKRTEAFKAVSLLHEGSWFEIPTSYGALMSYVQQHHLTPSGVNRELYINADFRNPEANVTEIQLGIQ